MPQTVVVDTSAILSVFEEKVNLESQLADLLGSVSIVIPSAARDELSALGTAASKAAGALCTRYGTYNCSRRGDEGVIEAALELHAYAAVTNDAELADRMVKLGVRVIRLMGRKRFAFYRSDEVQ
jgi:rRNA-processing protein FCF1